MVGAEACVAVVPQGGAAATEEATAIRIRQGEAIAVAIVAAVVATGRTERHQKRRQMLRWIISCKDLVLSTWFRQKVQGVWNGERWKTLLYCSPMRSDQMVVEGFEE